MTKLFLQILIFKITFCSSSNSFSYKRIFYFTMISFSLIEYEFEFFFLIIFISSLIRERHESSSIQKWHESEDHYRNFLIFQEIVRLSKWCEIIALAAKRFCKSSMTCRNRIALTAKRFCKNWMTCEDRDALTAKRHEFNENEIPRKRSFNQVRTRAAD